MGGVYDPKSRRYNRNSLPFSSLFLGLEVNKRINFDKRRKKTKNGNVGVVEEQEQMMVGIDL